jgi:hypothetical protein
MTNRLLMLATLVLVTIMTERRDTAQATDETYVSPEFVKWRNERTEQLNKELDERRFGKRLKRIGM